MEEPELSREVNRRIHGIAVSWEESEVDYVCECDAYECRAWARVSRDEFQRVLDQPARTCWPRGITAATLRRCAPGRVSRCRAM